MELQEKNGNLVSNHVKLNPELSGIVMAAMLVDKRITVSFRWELNSLFIYISCKFCEKNCLVRQHSRLVANHQSFKHTVRLSQLCSFLMY